MAYAEAPMGKHQASSIKFQKSSKIQAPKGHLEFGIWNFFGAWNLKFSAFCVFTLFGLSSLPPRTFAASNSLLYQCGEQVFMIDPKNEWREEGEVPVYNGREITLDPGTPFPSTVTVIKKIVWNEEKIAGALEESIGVLLNRDPGSVRITKDAEGKINFEGIGLNGRKIDHKRAAELTVFALEEGVSIIQLPVIETPPTVTVEDPELKALGITELVTVGESDYAGSPKNRKHNIGVGLIRFNGHIIQKDAEFSFGDVLGPVNGSTGYLPELTILGEKTLPEFGGGLCQVSTTAYRGAWLGGFPITERRNHSYAVRFYAPAGTDATVYPPWTDMKFVNNTDGALLLQTHSENDKAYFLYYGTKQKDKTVELVGPFTWDLIAPPPDRIEYTEELQPGESRIVSKPVPGMKAMWYRIISENNEEQEPEEFASFYEARPYYEEIGMELPPPTIITTPERDVLQLDEETTLTFPRKGGRTGPRIRVRE